MKNTSDYKMFTTLKNKTMNSGQLFICSTIDGNTLVLRAWDLEHAELYMKNDGGGIDGRPELVYPYAHADVLKKYKVKDIRNKKYKRPIGRTRSSKKVVDKEILEEG